MKPPSLFFPLLLLPPALASINWDIYERGVVKSFRWSRSFPDDSSDPLGFDVHCRASATFHAKLYRLSDLPADPPAGLAPWREAIEDVLRRIDYLGSFDGVDHKDTDREIVVMEYTAVPEPVRNWIEEQQRVGEQEGDGYKKQWYFGVFEKPKKEGDKVWNTVKPRPTAVEGGGEKVVVPVVRGEDKIVVFPAGAAYEILPLWVSKGSSCEREYFSGLPLGVVVLTWNGMGWLIFTGALSNLTKYKPQAEDDTILAWIMDHTKPDRDLGKRDIRFRVEALSVTETEDGKRTRLMWEKLHRTVRRNERKIQKEERMKAREEILSGGRIRDEL